MAELGEDEPVYSFLPLIKNYQIAKPLCYSIWLKKGKTENFLYQFRAISIFFDQFTQHKGQKTPIHFFLDCGWR